jgi:addiction module RelB/DinJ family antitoxin
MPKSSSVYTRVEPELKEQVEQVLSKLGIPMANAINLFLHQIVLRKGIPFDVTLPQRMPLDYSALSREQFDTEIEKGFASLEAGRTVSAKEVRENMQRQYTS